MDDTRILTYFRLILPLAISCLLTIRFPLVALVFAAMVLTAGMLWKVGTQRGRVGGSGVLLLVGVVLVLPPIADVTAGLVL